MMTNDVLHIFWLSISSSSLGTRVSSRFQAYSQKPIFNTVEHLGWSFADIVNRLKPLSIFAKKLRCDVRPGSKYASVSSH